MKHLAREIRCAFITDWVVVIIIEISHHLALVHRTLHHGRSNWSSIHSLSSNACPIILTFNWFNSRSRLRKAGPACHLVIISLILESSLLLCESLAAIIIRCSLTCIDGIILILIAIKVSLIYHFSHTTTIFRALVQINKRWSVLCVLSKHRIRFHLMRSTQIELIMIIGRKCSLSLILRLHPCWPNGSFIVVTSHSWDWPHIILKLEWWTPILLRVATRRVIHLQNIRMN